MTIRFTIKNMIPKNRYDKISQKIKKIVLHVIQ